MYQPGLQSIDSACTGLCESGSSSRMGSPKVAPMIKESSGRNRATSSDVCSSSRDGVGGATLSAFGKVLQASAIDNSSFQLPLGMNKPLGHEMDDMPYARSPENMARGAGFNVAATY